MQSIDALTAKAQKAWAPPKKVTLSQWADQNAYLSAESSGQEGRWRTLPYQRGIMDAMTDPAIEQVVFMKSARVGYTKCLNNLIGYHIHQDPCPIMLVQPTESDAEGYSKEEIVPMLRDTKVLHGLVAEPRSRDSGNKILDKQFPGGVLSMVGANSPRGFRRVSRRVVLFDEVDGYPLSAGAEGDPVKLGIMRSDYYWNRKIVAGSTPTVKDISRIEALFLQTDQRRYFVPCPHCDTLQFLEWGTNVPHGIKWPSRRPLEAVYICKHCGCTIKPEQKYEMIEAGDWQPTANPIRERLAGFHLWAAYSYSPNATWGKIAQEWVEAQSDQELLKTFVNTVLGETWEEGEKTTIHDLLKRAEAAPLRIVRPEMFVLTAGVDVQGDRVEAYIWAWGRGLERQLVDRRVIYGDPGLQEGEPGSPWTELTEYLRTPLEHANGGSMLVRAAFVDSGGHHTQSVYGYTRRHQGTHVYACKGLSVSGRSILGKPSDVDINWKGQKIKKGARLWPIGTDTAKSEIYGRLRTTEPGAGYVHLSKEMPSEVFEQLTAERMVPKYTKGHAKMEWVKPPGKRNEALDCAVYALAAAIFVGIDRWSAADWDRAQALVQPRKPKEESVQAKPAPVAKTPRPAVARQWQSSPQAGRSW